MKLEEYKHCLEATQLENKINKLKKSKGHVDSLRENHKRRIEEKTRIQLFDLIETYTYATGKYLVCKKEEIKCNSIIKQYKNK